MDKEFIYTKENMWEIMVLALGIMAKPSQWLLRLKKSGVLKDLLPELDKLFETPEQVKYHPLGNTGLHTANAIDCVQGSLDLLHIRFATLLHDIGKGITPKEQLPSHKGHDERGPQLIKDICERLHVPDEYRDFAMKCCRYHMLYYKFPKMRINRLYDILDEFTGMESLYNFFNFSMVCMADDISEIENPLEEFDRRKIIANIFMYMSTIFYSAKSVTEENTPILKRYDGELKKFRLREERIRKIKLDLEGIDYEKFGFQD